MHTRWYRSWKIPNSLRTFYYQISDNEKNRFFSLRLDFDTGVLLGHGFDKSDSPEQLIMGRWEEVEWQFERTDADSTKQDHQLLDYQKKELYENMMIHHAEQWEFRPGNF